MSHQFLVVGLGRLGIAMVGTLDSLGHEVLAVDAKEGLIQALANDMPNVHFVAADATDEDVLLGLNVQDFDAAAVVIGENHVEAGILTTANLKEIGLPLIVARATSKLHARVLERVGADRIIQPELEMGEQAARVLASPGMLDYVDLGENEALIEARVPSQWVDKSLAELALSRSLGLTVVALKPREGEGKLPRGDTVLREGDVIVVGGTKKRLDASPLSGRPPGRRR
ncbi:MAG: Trk system potassium uptake protein TrkA [uncultured Rubrobacteraceae bacterium]|uniref:Trk system potassium uptake protein TrkA n=1 Tax=uncultured Rubrobacteraceae bacterium TaxID=349277 RepID=A0A6J4QIS3_9ACTN|nr:MAG: Trk system potassium uptake protein TrkA [uncultured Rubrobacteraceae bacterium]